MRGQGKSCLNVNTINFHIFTTNPSFCKKYKYFSIKLCEILSIIYLVKNFKNMGLKKLKSVYNMSKYMIIIIIKSKKKNNMK